MTGSTRGSGLSGGPGARRGWWPPPGRAHRRV